MADVGHNGRGGIRKRSPALANFGALLHIPVGGCGCSSGVEHHVANVRVEGSNPFARSNSPSARDHRARASIPSNLQLMISVTPDIRRWRAAPLPAPNHHPYRGAGHLPHAGEV